MKYKEFDSSTSFRQSNIELLRIITMFMIVGCHFATHGQFQWGKTEITLPRIWWNILELGGNFGTDIFVIISGYFLITDKHFFPKTSRVIMLWHQVLFYSIIMTFLNIKSGGGIARQIIFTFLPILTGRWWFISCYFILYLIHPFVNKALITLNKKQYQLLLLIVILYWSLIPMITTYDFQSSNLILFIMLYSIGGYIHVYGFRKNENSKTFFCIWLVLSALTVLSSVALLLIGRRFPVFADHHLHFYSPYSTLTIARAICFFLAFERVHIKPNRMINIIASACFGVYLIHDASSMRQILWIGIFKSNSFQNTNLIILYSIAVIFLIYFCCTVIELFRICAIEIPTSKYVNSISNKINCFWRKTYRSLIRFVFGRDESTEGYCGTE